MSVNNGMSKMIKTLILLFLPSPSKVSEVRVRQDLIVIVDGPNIEN